ncbi:MAG: flagellar protein [Candidatus Omnitrophica bacterium]|nr:flagellar protein [Candidatus Omnitrophota bacterium]MBD3269139.1 flagellar protein [Candidatus Omnitrophota bacterium]
MADFNPIKPIRTPEIDRTKQPQPSKVTPRKGASFKDVLEAKLDHEIKFSGHALDRIQRRDIVIDDGKLGKLKEAVSKADSKGARSSLVLMDDLALIVSIQNRTVITAIDGSNIKENVFTNIDSAIIV